KGHYTSDLLHPYYTKSFSVQLAEMYSQVFYRFLSGGDGVLRKGVEFSGFLPVKVILRIKSLHFTSKLGFEPGGIKTGYLGCTTRPVLQTVPVIADGTTDRGKRT